MTDPVSGAVTAGLAGVSLLTSVLGGQAQGAAEKQQAQATSANDLFQAGIALQNQQIQKANAGYALQQGEQSAMVIGQGVRAQVGQIKAAQGASGLNVNLGTAPDVVAGQRKIGMEEQSLTRETAAKTAYDYDVSAWQYGQQNQLDIASAINTTAALPLQEEATFLGTAASVSTKWLGFNQAGDFSGIGSAVSDIGSYLNGSLAGAAGGFG